MKKSGLSPPNCSELNISYSLVKERDFSASLNAKFFHESFFLFSFLFNYVLKNHLRSWKWVEKRFLRRTNEPIFSRSSDVSKSWTAPEVTGQTEGIAATTDGGRELSAKLLERRHIGELVSDCATACHAFELLLEAS